MVIRKLRPEDDRFAVSRIYEESWKTAYKNIVPQNFLDSIEPGRWAAHLDNGQIHHLLLIEDGAFIGTASYCESRLPAFAGFGEIVSIYLLPEYMGRGLGKKLFETVVERLQKMGFNHIFLWVLEKNYRARKFYEKMGFTSSGEFLDDDIGGKQLREVQYLRRL